jgi:hypothetical protein
MSIDTSGHGIIKAFEKFPVIGVDALGVLLKIFIKAFDVSGVRLCDIGKVLHGKEV